MWWVILPASSTPVTDCDTRWCSASAPRNRNSVFAFGAHKMRIQCRRDRRNRFQELPESASTNGHTVMPDAGAEARGVGGSAQRTAHSAGSAAAHGQAQVGGGTDTKSPRHAPPPPLLRQDRGITYGLADVLAGQVHLLRQPLQQRRLVAMVTRIQDSTACHTARHTTRECQRR